MNALETVQLRVFFREGNTVEQRCCDVAAELSSMPTNLAFVWGVECLSVTF